MFIELQIWSDEILLSGSDDGKIRIWNSSDWTLIKTLYGCDNNKTLTSIISLNIILDSYLVSGCRDGAIKVWEPSEI